MICTRKYWAGAWGTCEQQNPLGLRKYHFVPCNMCPHRNVAVHFALTSTCKYSKNSYKKEKDLNKYSQSGSWWWQEQSVQNSTESNSRKYDKSFKHHILEWIPLHLHWITILVPGANYATFYWSAKLPTFHTPLYKCYYATVLVNVVRHDYFCCLPSCHRRI